MNSNNTPALPVLIRLLLISIALTIASGIGDVVRKALRDELPRHSGLREFCLSQGLEQVAALQRDLPEFTLTHASETYTAPVKDWPGVRRGRKGLNNCNGIWSLHGDHRV